MASNTIGSIAEFNSENEKIVAYLERVQLFFEANSIKDDKQVPVFLTVIGSTTYALLSNLVSPEKPKEKSFKQLAEVLRRHFDPKPLIIAERFHFHRREQASGESINDYVAELRRLATHCDFGNYLEQALRDRLVCGIRHENTQKRLLSEADLSLTRAIDIARSIEATEMQTSQLKGTSSAPVMKITQTVSRRVPDTRPDIPAKQVKCTRCGGANHKAKDCRHRNSECFKCHKTGHLSSVCRSKKTTHQAKWIEDTEQQEYSDSTVFQLSGKSPNPFRVELCVQEKPLLFEIDTGASVTLISEETYNEHYQNSPLQKSSLRLKTYTGEPLQVLGQMTVTVSYHSQQGSYTLYVVKGAGPSLLGRDWLKHIRLDWKAIATTVNQINSPSYQTLLDQYSEVFRDELGTLKSTQAHLEVQPNSNPKFCKPRQVPFSLKEPLEKELSRLECLGILQKVMHSEWAAPVVVVPKGDGCLRVCGDYKTTVNPVLVVDKYPLPRPDDLMSQLAGGQRFSKIDLSQAYQQVQLDDESRKFVTINTHQGLYQYTRVPFGISSAPALFQKIMDTILQGVPNTICYLDDILVTGKNETEHLRNLEEVLKRLQQNGLRVKPEKCKFLQPSVEYLGHRIDASGVHTTMKKVEAIKRAPTPQDVQQLRAFLGLLHYYGKFIPNLSSILHPLNQLLKSQSSWKWSQACVKAFQQAKDKLADAPVLAHYDATKKLKLATDASSYGIGAVISHTYDDGSERPIAYASRTLSNAEKHYAQIDKEALAIIFGIQKFHAYLYGRKFVLVTDHKPLVSLFGPKKAIPPLAAARLQRWAITLSAYSYDIEYKPTSQHANADSLSRLPLRSTESSEDVVNVFNVAQVEALPLTSQQIATATKKDPVLSQVFRYTQSGWPSEVAEVLLPYWNRRSEFTIEQDCLLWGIRVVIPQKWQERVLGEFHRDHPGIVRMKAVARSYAWWEGIDKDIETLVKSCKSCQTIRNTPPMAPLHPWLWPTKPWQRLHLDFAGPFQGRMYLLVSDAHSKWPEIISMKSTTASRTIEELRKLFASYGLPEQIVTDNGPQFISEEFATFTKANGVKHIKSAPYHPSTNGAVERLVQTFKKSMKASQNDGRSHSQRLASFLLSYRSTTHSTTHETPSDLFLKRKLRTRLDLLRPDVNNTVHNEQAKQKKNHDRHCQGRQYFIGQNVSARNFRAGPPWSAGVVVERLGPLTYLVQVTSGVFWRRHVDHLRPIDDAAKVPDQGQSTSSMSDLPVQSDFIPVPGTENTETLPVCEQAPTSIPERRYPRRLNRRPPSRYN